jgi:hypothetical protein
MTIKNLYPNVRPALSLDFARTKTLDSRVAFTRASTGTYVGADGLIKTAASGAARFDHNPTTGESLGLLVEEARTNLALYSEQFDNAAWTKNSTTVTANAITAPDSTLTADRLLETATTATFYAFISNPAPTPGTYTASVYAKGDGSGRLLDLVLQQSSTYRQAYFNLTTGVVSSVDAALTASIQALPNGWFRCSVTGTSSNNTTPFLFTSVTAGENSVYVNRAGNASAGIYIWGAQLEAGSFPTSYIPTTSATVTRAAEVASVSNTSSSIYPTSNFTVVNSPFGTTGGSTSLSLFGPTIKRTAVYGSNLSQVQTTSLGDINDGFWRWRVLGSSFALPNFITDGNITVDWGDGTVETLTTSEHVFTNGGGYHDIGFRMNSGTRFLPAIQGNTTYKDRLVAIGPMPSSIKLDPSSCFQGCANLKIVDGALSFTGGTIFTNTWFLNYSLTSFAWIDTSSATSMINTWYGAPFTSFPLINTSSVTVFANTWLGCSNLASFPLINTSSATEMSGAWYVCSSLTSFPLINTSNVTSFSGTWFQCTGLTSFPLINTSLGTIFTDTWRTCTSLTSFPALNFSSATRFDTAWYNCSSLTTFPANMFNTTGTLIAAAFIGAFQACALNATSIENILTSLVTNGRSGITLDLNGGTNAGASTWTAPALAAYATLISRGWTISRNA